MGAGLSEEVLYNHEPMQEMEDDMFGTVTLHQSKKNKLTLKCEKFYSPETIPYFNQLTSSDFSFVKKRLQSLPADIYSAVLTDFLVEDDLFEAVAIFDVGSWSLEDLVVDHGDVIPEEAGIGFLYTVACLGSYLEDHLHYFPKIDTNSIFISVAGLKFLNPFLYDEYVHDHTMVSCRQFF